MSFQAMTEAVRLDGLEPLEKFVLIVLANYAGTDNTLFPSQKTLAANTSLSERTVRHYLRTLEARGLIRKGKRYAGGSRTSDLITLLFIPAVAAAMAPPIPANHDVHTGKRQRFIPAVAAAKPIIESVREPTRARGEARSPPDGGALLTPEERRAAGAELKELAQRLRRKAG